MADLLMADQWNETDRGVTAASGTTKARIERAALVLFCARGVDAVTTREIASASGVSEGALYRHFPGKEALGETLYFAIHHRLAQEIRRAGEQHNNIEGQAGAIVRAYCAVADEDWSLFAYHLLMTHRFLPYTDKSAPQRAEQHNPVAVVESLVTHAIENGEIPAGDPVLKSAAALGVVLQTALHKAYGRLQGDLTPHCDTFARAVIAVLKS